jgi:hypothetical protein
VGTHIRKQTDGNVVEKGSDVMMFVPSFIKIGSGIRKLIGGEADTL